jgi:hypothetical protein
VLEHLVIHSVEGDEQDKDEKNNFSKEESWPFCDLALRNSSKKVVLLPTMVW